MASWRKTAPTNASFEFIVNAQVFADPEHVPAQDANAQPVAGFAVSVSAVPDGTYELQSLPQEMAEGALVIVPGPVLDTVRIGWARRNSTGRKVPPAALPLRNVPRASSTGAQSPPAVQY